MGSPSGSDPDNVTGSDSSSATLRLCAFALGGSLGAVMLSVTAPVFVHFESGFEFVVPLSHTVYVNDAVPVNPASGVYVIVPPTMLTVPCVSPPPVTAVTCKVWLASLAGPGVSLANNDVAFIA